jgi:hypothetical protein
LPKNFKPVTQSIFARLAAPTLLLGVVSTCFSASFLGLKPAPSIGFPRINLIQSTDKQCFASNARPKEVSEPAWGFFGHKRINRLAVLTLPPEMMVFFKPNIDYLTDHAVDPDMRRYATKHEAPRHYIDLDNYGAPPFDGLPRLWLDAMVAYTDLWAVNAPGDTVLLFGRQRPVSAAMERAYQDYFARQVLPQYYRDEELLNVDSLAAFLQTTGAEMLPQSAFFKEHLSEHGVLPWNLQRMQRQLTEAFRVRDGQRVLKLCADMGHYIGDAHVPLHTTSNYNGQKSNQHGIHGFWESRIPELFADESYDYFVGKPEYIQRPNDWFWEIALASNALVDSVLTIERMMRLGFPTDRQMCPDMRLGVMLVTPCRDFAAAYQQAMNGMVERRMRAAIHAVSSAWYTAWVDAGEPDLSDMRNTALSEAERKEQELLRKNFQQGKILGRPEEH